MTALQILRQEKRELLADMKEAGIKRISCNNRIDGQTFRCNSKLAQLTRAIEIVKMKG